MAVEFRPMQDHFDAPQNPGPEAARPLVEEIDLKRLFQTIDGLAARQAAVDHFLKTGSNHVSVAGAMGDYEAMFDPLNNQGTPAQKDAVINVESQILRMNALKGTRGRNDFADKRNIDRLERARNWMEVDARTTLIAVPKGNVPQLESIPEEQPFSGTEGAKPLINSKPIEHAGRVALAAGVIAMPTTGLDRSPFDSQANNTTNQAETRASDQHVITVSRSDLNTRLMSILTAGFNEHSLTVNDSGVVTQRISLGGVDYDVTLTPTDIQKLQKIHGGLQNEDGGEKRFKVYLAMVGKAMRMPVEPTDGPPATRTARATKTATATATEPNQTATPGTTQEPSPTTPVEPSPTTAATATETPTPTETGPLTELALKTGDTIVITDGTSIKYAMMGKNGDKESGAAAVGYDFAKMINPVIDGEWVVGTVIKDGKQLTIREPLNQLDKNLRTRLKQGDSQTDERLRSEVSIWKGSDVPGTEKPVRITANYNGTTGTYGRTFFGNFESGAQIELSGKATGNAKTGDMVIMSWDEATRKGEMLTFRYNIQGARWTILSSSQASTSFAALIESRKTLDGSIDELQAEKELYQFPVGQTDLKVQTVGKNIHILDKEGKVTQTIPLSIAMASGLNFVDFARTGSQKSQAVITLNRAHISFSHSLEGTPLQSAENRLPTLVDLAEANGVRIMAQGDSEFFSTQPGLLELYARTTHLIDTNSLYTDGSALQDYLLDQKRNPAIVLGAGMSQQELFSIIDEHPNAVFQFVARGTSSGPEGMVVKPDGTLADKRKLQEVLNYAKTKGSEVILNTTTPPDKNLFRVSQTEGTTSLSPQLRLLEELKTLRNQDVLTVLLAGDSRYILDPNLSRTELVASVQYALKVMQDEGFKVGLTNISGPNADYQTLIGEIASGLKNITLGFGTSLSTETKPVGLFDYTGGPVAEYQIMSYSDGEDALYNALLNNLSAK